MTSSSTLARDRYPEGVIDHIVAAAERQAARSQGRRRGWILAAWAAVSLLWASGVGFELCHRARVEARMSAEIERELGSSSCAGGNCAAAATEPAPEGEWIDVTETYLKFGYKKVLQWMFLPPLALLVVSLPIYLVRRRPLPHRASGQVAA
jgi:hypothetical protein